MIQSKDFIRRSELLSICLNGAEFSKADYADIFKVAEITINRDINSLRKNGVLIYSKKGKVQLIEKPSNDILIKYSSEYLPLKLNSGIFSTQIKTCSKIVPNFYPLLTLIAKAINERYYLTIRYKRLYDNMIQNYRLKPLELKNSDYNWILHGIKEGESIVKTFYISRIENLVLNEEKFIQVSESVTKGKQYEIVLKFHPEVEEEVMYKIWFENYTLNRDSKGFIILTTTHEINNRLAAWCLSWWDKIKIVKPNKLKVYIKDMCKYFFKNN